MGPQAAAGQRHLSASRLASKPWNAIGRTNPVAGQRPAIAAPVGTECAAALGKRWIVPEQGLQVAAQHLVLRCAGPLHRECHRQFMRC